MMENTVYYIQRLEKSLKLSRLLLVQKQACCADTCLDADTFYSVDGADITDASCSARFLLSKASSLLSFNDRTTDTGT